MNHYKNALEVLKILNDNNYEAYIVGGFVRDKLLQLPTTDIDITTNAKVEDIIKLFNVNDTHGINYGSIKIMYNSYQYEVTSYRMDISYENNRHPTTIYTSDINEDIKRRDFTINALLMDKNENIIDKIDAINDLNHYTIKAIGNPLIRFEEDSLRILRAFYLVSKLNFNIDIHTFEAIDLKAHFISKLSYIRIHSELAKIIDNKHQLKALKLIFQSNVINYLPNLKEGIKCIIDTNKTIDNITLFYALCFYFEGINEFYNFPKNYKIKLQKIIELAQICSDNNYNKLILYSYGLEVCLYSNKLNNLIYNKEDIQENITNEYNKLPIKKVCDLQFKGQDILKMTNKKDNLSFIAIIIDQIKYEVLMGNLKNDYNTIKEYVIMNKLLE